MLNTSNENYRRKSYIFNDDSSQIDFLEKKKKMKNRFKEIKHYDNITKMRETYFLLEENYIR